MLDSRVPGHNMWNTGERQVVQLIGQNLLLRWVTAMAITSLCYGILIPIAITVAYSITKYPGQTWHSRWQLVIVCLGISAFTTHLVLRLGIAITEHQFFKLIRVLRQNIIFDSDTIYASWNVAQIWLECITPIINDAFIIWRAWVVFEKRRWAHFISMGLCFSTFVFTVFWLSTSIDSDLDMAPILVLTPLLPPSDGIRSSNFGTLTLQQLVTMFLSFMTNFVATCFISWTSLSYDNFLRANMDGQSFRSTRARRILYLLVDAGTVYVLLQFVYIVMVIAVRPHLIAPHFTWSDDGGLGQEPQTTVTSDVIQQLNSRVQVLEQGLMTSTLCAVIESIYICFSFVYPALTIALIRGPLSIAGVHETVTSLRTSRTYD